MTPRSLITGAIGGLGSPILATLLIIVPASHIVAGSSRASEPTLKTANGTVELRQVDYQQEASLISAFADVDILFFVSAPIMDTATRMKAHSNAVAAAKVSGITHIYYSSRPFNGTKPTSTNEVMQART